MSYEEKDRGHKSFDTGDVESSPTVADLLVEKRSLEGQVAELTAQCAHLQNARAATEASNQSNSMALAAIAEDVKGPLAEIVRTMNNIVSAPTEPGVARKLLEAGSSGAVLLGLLDMLVDLPDLEDGNLCPDEDMLESRLIIEAAVGDLEPLAARKGLKLKCRIDPAVPGRAIGDASRLRQVMLYCTYSVIDVAVKGDVGMIVNVSETTEDFTTVKFAVYNNGEGLDPDRLREVLHSLPEVDPGRRPGARAWITMRRARQLVELMGGALIVDTIGANGFSYTFSVRLGNSALLHGERRDNGRLLQETLDCSLGPVIDLSGGGMRVLCRRLPRPKTKVVLLDSRVALKVKAELMWKNRVGPNHHEVGLRFDDPSPQQMEMIKDISHRHGLRRVQM
jgi:hypothetical protein